MLIYALSFIIFLLTIITPASGKETGNSKELNLMPVPAKVGLTNEKFRLDTSFTMVVMGDAGKKVYSGATRALRRLSERTGLFLSQDYLCSEAIVESPDLIVTCQRSGKVELGEVESYSLVVTTKQLSITAETDLGALHGLETFLQLLSVDEQGYYFPGVEIEKVKIPRGQAELMIVSAIEKLIAACGS